MLAIASTGSGTDLARAPAPPPSEFSLGIEEEYFIVCNKTGQLDDSSRGILLREAQGCLGAAVNSEMLQSQIEIASRILYDMQTARDELTFARRVLCDLFSGNLDHCRYELFPALK